MLLCDKYIIGADYIKNECLLCEVGTINVDKNAGFHTLKQKIFVSMCLLIVVIVLFVVLHYLNVYVSPNLEVSRRLTLSYMEGLLTIPYCVMSFNFIFKLSAKIK
jgi:hypothetical protein